MKGLVHSLDSFGSVDGPGVRFLIFLQGCRMRCRYCHNPDSWPLDSSDAQAYSVAELLDIAERYRSYWGKDGGITVSGGEPLLQMNFLVELFEEAHQRGINTCLDTSGEPFRCGDRAYLSMFRRLMRSTDIVLFDLKHISSSEHRMLTGHTNENILECAREISHCGVDMWIRHVLVPQLTDDDFHLKAMRRFLDSLVSVRRVEILPYHDMARFKYEKLGLAYPLSDTPAPDAESMARAKALLNCK